MAWCGMASEVMSVGVGLNTPIGAVLSDPKGVFDGLQVDLFGDMLKAGARFSSHGALAGLNLLGNISGPGQGISTDGPLSSLVNNRSSGLTS